MAEYIDREALKQHIGSYAGMFTDELGFAVSLPAVLSGIDFAPAADVVEVVRCKDCKWYKLHPDGDNGERMCKYWGEWIPTEETDFCSRGEKK